MSVLADAANLFNGSYIGAFVSHGTANSSAWMMGVSIIEKAFSFIIYVFLARLLDIEDFGIVAFCILFLEFLVVLITTGMREFIVTRKDIDKTLLNTCFISIIFAALFVLTIFYHIFPYFIGEKSSPLLMDLFNVLIFLPLVSSLSIVQFAMMQRKLRFKALALRSLVATIISGSIALYFAYDGAGAWALVVYKFLYVAVDTIILTFATRFIPGLAFSLSIFKSAYKFSIPLILSEAFNFWSSRIMELFVSVFFGPTSYAILDVSRKFTKLIQQVSLTALRAVCLSHIVTAHAGGKGTAFIKFTSYVCLVVTPLLLSLGIFSDKYIPIIFGEQWQPAIPIVEIISLSAFAQCVAWYYSLLLIANERTKEVFYINLSVFLLSVAAGLASYRLEFANYIAIQVIVINVTCFAKIAYLRYARLVSTPDIISFLLPAACFVITFSLFALTIENYVFLIPALNGFLVIPAIIVGCLISFSCAILVTYLFFKTYMTLLFSESKSFVLQKRNKEQL